MGVNFAVLKENIFTTIDIKAIIVRVVIPHLQGDTGDVHILTVNQMNPPKGRILIGQPGKR